MPRSSIVGRIVVGVVVAASVVTGCGTSKGASFADKSGEQIAQASEKDMTALSSVRLTASLTEDGAKFDLELASDRDSNCRGTIGMYGTTGDFIRVDGAEYLRGSSTFWTKMGGADGEQVQKFLGHRWAKLAGKSQFSSFCDLDAFIKDMKSGDDDSGMVKGKVTTVGGRKAVEVTTKENGGTIHAWVAITGKHYILRMEQVGGDEPGTITFSGFDEPVDAKAPAGAVDMASLGG
jgi:hypothetical protein